MPVRLEFLRRRADMAKPVKIAVIIAAGAIAIAGIQMLPFSSPNPGTHAAMGPPISPAEMMRASGPLPETKVDSYN
jgi:hypothetical protein